MLKNIVIISAFSVVISGCDVLFGGHTGQVIAEEPVSELTEREQMIEQVVKLPAFFIFPRKQVGFVVP